MRRPLHFDLWLGVVLACFILLAWANWGKLESPIVDIGREIEISARISDGQLPYRDVATYYTPLGYYANALALLLFGHHLEVLFAVGLLLALTATLLFYRLAKRLMNQRWATLCSICMLIYCAIGPGLFNFIMPYSCGAVYAIVLCLLALTFLDYYICQRQLGWLIASAIACGLAGLAKQEYGVAILAGVLVGVNIYVPQTLKTRIKHNILVLIVASVCVFVPLAILSVQVSWQELSSSLFPASQIVSINRDSVSLRKTLSVWRDSFKVFIVASSLIFASLAVAHKLLNSKWVKIPIKLRSLVEALLGFALSLLVLYCLNRSSLKVALNPLGDLSWSIPVLVGWFTLNRQKLYQVKHKSLLWALLVFSLILNARWGFYINFYGLYAVPIVILFFTMLHNISQRFKKQIWRYLLICLLFGGTSNVKGLLVSYSHTVHSNYGTFYTKNATLASAFNQTTKAIDASKASSVLILPEGNILNFLTATHSPSRELTFLPHVLPTAMDEQKFIRRMQVNPPQLIVYVPRPFIEWGYPVYADFDPLVDRWITQQHRLIYSFPMDDSAIRIYAHDK